MKITLRKANTVQNAISQELKNLDLACSININEFEDPKDQIKNAREKFFEQSATREKLIGALYEIRRKVAQANAEVGINNMLADVAMLEKQVSYSTNLASKGAQQPMRVINGRIKKITETTDRYSLHADTVSTSIFTEQEVEEFKNTSAELKREKQKLQDELLELNVQTQIELDDGTVLFLEKAHII